MRKIYYEDIKDNGLPYVRNLIHWYMQIGEKETWYFLGRKEQFTVNQDQEKYDCSFYLEYLRYGYDRESIEKLEEDIQHHHYQFVHREREQWTLEQEKERELSYVEINIEKGSPIERFKDCIDYLFLTLEPVIRVLRKDIEQGREQFGIYDLPLEKKGHRRALDDMPIRCRSLFYEDIETISVKELEEWQAFYERWLQKQNKYFLDKKKSYPGMKNAFAIKYHKREIQATTQSEWETELEKIGYQFSHKPENGWTEQRQAKLFRVIDEAANTSSYLFLGAREDIIEVENTEEI